MKTWRFMGWPIILTSKIRKKKICTNSLLVRPPLDKAKESIPSLRKMMLRFKMS